MIKAASLTIDLNLRDFSHFLQEQGLTHRIIEESGQQVIWVNSEADAEWVRRALKQWQESGWQRRTESRPAEVRPRGSNFLTLVLASPVTMALIAICLFVALVSMLGTQLGRVAFLFFPPVSVDGLASLLADLVNPVLFLRSLSPMFLHFSELHLIFNMLWLWYFGRQLESIHTGWVFLLLVVITSFVSNVTQYLSTDLNNFGGMSGVVYGLVGYTWIIHSFMPRSRLLLNNSMFAFFVVALVLMEVFAGSWIATAAHVGGLISGLLLGVAMVLFYRVVLKRTAITKPVGAVNNL